MGLIYRYIDTTNGVVKYIGIIWSETRTLAQRVREHSEHDSWVQECSWKVEYLDVHITTRTDAEMLEAHFIAKYGTDKYYNVSKQGWGESGFIDISEKKWRPFVPGEEGARSPSKKAPSGSFYIDCWPTSDIFYTNDGTMIYFPCDMLRFAARTGSKKISSAYIPSISFVTAALRHKGYSCLCDAEGDIVEWKDSDSSDSRSLLWGDFELVGKKDALLTRREFHIETVMYKGSSLVEFAKLNNLTLFDAIDLSER